MVYRPVPPRHRPSRPLPPTCYPWGMLGWDLGDRHGQGGAGLSVGHGVRWSGGAESYPERHVFFFNIMSCAENISQNMFAYPSVAQLYSCQYLLGYINVYITSVSRPRHILYPFFLLLPVRSSKKIRAYFFRRDLQPT